MKKLSGAILIILIFSVFSSCDKKTEPPEPVKYVTAVGKALYTSAEGGEKLILRGVNAGGLFVTEDWMCPTSLEGNLSGGNGMFELYDALTLSIGGEKTREAFDLYRDKWWTEEDFDNIANMGLNAIRLPFTWRDGDFSRIDRFIGECAERGLYVILDLHGAYGSQNGRHHSGDTRGGGDLYGNEENMAATEALWVRVAERYKNNGTVAGYDLLNEPEGYPGGSMNWATPQWGFYDRLYEAVRAVDQNHLIIMEPVWELDNLPDPELFGWTNVAYGPHFYLWEDGNDFEAEKTFLSEKIEIDKARDYNVPVYVGEFTFFNSPESWEYGLNLFEEQGWSWTMWTYKVYGRGSSWGLYTGPDRTAENVVTKYDDIETIRNKWGSLETSKSFTPNQRLIDIIREIVHI
jgi:Endoglucanase